MEDGQLKPQAAHSAEVNGISWTVHPARERIVAAVFAVGVIVAVAWLSATLMNEAWWALFAAVVMFAALRRFFLPSTFRVDERGVSAVCGGVRQFYDWADIRRFLHDTGGAYVSTRTRSSPLDLFRGIHLSFTDNAEAAVARIELGLRSKGHASCSG